MKTFRILLALIFLVSFSGIGINKHEGSRSLAQQPAKEVHVYICDSENAYAYHASNSCRGINKCKSEILKVTKSDAVKKYERKACKICYK